MKKNAHRNLVAALGYPKRAPDITYLEIPGPDGKKWVHPILCPVKVFQKAATEQKQIWEQRLRGREDAAGSFRQKMRHHPVVAKHPSLKPKDFAKSLALGIHADGAPMTKHESLFTISWNSLFAEGTTMDTRFIFTCIKKSDIGEGTLEALWSYLAWAFNTLASGETATADWQGRPIGCKKEPLAHGWKAFCVLLRGDWEFFANNIGLPRWDCAENCCWLCKAGITQKKYTDCSEKAAWRPTLRTHESWLAEILAAGKTPCAIFKIVGLRLEMIMIDTLHAVDQGLSVHLIANIFVEVMPNFGSNQKQQAANLQKDLQEWYKSQPLKTRSSKLQGSLTYERIKTSSEWPKLKCKAAATRHLAKYASSLAARFDSGSPHDRRRRAAAELLVRFYEIIEEGGQFLTDEQQKELATLSRFLLGSYFALSAEALRNGLRLWKVTQKFHAFQHLCEVQSQIMNPRFFLVLCRRGPATTCWRYCYGLLSAAIGLHGALPLGHLDVR